MFFTACMKRFLAKKRCILGQARTETETIDRECPVQINRIFELKEKLFFIIQSILFSEPRGCPDAYLDSAPEANQKNCQLETNRIKTDKAEYLNEVASCFS
jgi:hypothetical protein